MELKNEFEVKAAPEKVWLFMLNPERVVPCVPGAELSQVLSETQWEALAKIKLGPVKMSFKGTVDLIERDDARRHVILKATGIETKGKGRFTADVVSDVIAIDGGARVEVVTQLNITGKAAQFGRGLMADVAAQFTEEFAQNMEAELLAEAAIAEQTVAAEEASARPAEPDAVSAPAAPPVAPVRREAKPISGFSLMFRVLWRSFTRILKGLFGKRQPSS